MMAERLNVYDIWLSVAVKWQSLSSIQTMVFLAMTAPSMNWSEHCRKRLEFLP